MTRFIGVMLAASLVLGVGRVALADGAEDAKAVIDKAVKALGGAEKVGAVKAAVWKTKGKLTINDNDGNFNSKVTMQGVNHIRQEFEGEFDGNAIKGVVILNVDKAWRKIGEDAAPLEGDALANEKRLAYLQAVEVMPLFLKGEGFKLEDATDDKVDGKPAVMVKAVGPDGKDFQLFFDTDSGLLVKLSASVADFQGEDYKQDTTFSDYKEFDGIKRATKIETKRNGKKLVNAEITEFKSLDKVDPQSFAEPKSN